MNKQLQLLVQLQDIDSMIKELTDKEGEQEERLGFKIKGVETLKRARDELASRMDRRFLRIYQRLSSRYGRAVVPVLNRTCLGCFAILPTAKDQQGASNSEVLTCESCGRILYWL